MPRGILKQKGGGLALALLAGACGGSGRAAPPSPQASASSPTDPKAIFKKATEDLARSGQAERAKHEGAKAPDFALPDSKGHTVRLSNLLAKGPVVLTFYRGGWCPYCNLQLRSYQKALGEIHSLGAELVAVSPQLPDKTLSTVEKAELSFPVLSDLGNRVARSYGLVFRVSDEVVPIYKQFGIDLEASNGDKSHELPMPGTYVIDRDGTIRSAFVDADYTKRLPVERLLESLRALHGTATRESP